MVDARKYVSKYIKPDNVRDAPIQTRIVNVFEEDRYGRLVLELENGSQFTLNESNTETLLKAWGHNTDEWIGREVVLELGHYKDWRTDPPEEKETVKVRAVPPPGATQNGGTPPASKPLPPSLTASGGGGAARGDMDDEIPF
jgi:hypothetical protein